MGGESKQTTEQSQQSQTAPWATAQPALQGILAKLGPLIQNSGLTPGMTGAFNQLQQSAQRGNPYAGQFGGLASELLAGGGANDNAATLNQNFADYTRRLSPIANGQNIGPNGNPALRGYLDTIGNDVQNRVNSMFAGAGRDLSGLNVQTLGRGIAEGTAPVLAAQYNTDVGNMRGAADALYGAGNNNVAMLSNMQQQGLQNKQAGVGVAGQAIDAQNYGAQRMLDLEQMMQSLPAQTLGLLAQIGIPIAGLGSQSSGTGTSNTTNQMSGAQQFATIMGGLGSMFGGGQKKAG